jgi:hypothetical protein
MSRDKIVLEPEEKWFWGISFAEVVDNPCRKEVVESTFNVKEDPDGYPTPEGGALEVVHGITQSRFRRPSFTEGVLVEV